MSDKCDTPEFKEHLKVIGQYWANFYGKLEKWMEPEITVLYNTVLMDHKVFPTQHSLLKNATIKKHISSTHTWVPGKSRYLKKYDNWYQSPIECSVCKLHGSMHEEVGYGYEEVMDIPSRDSHGNPISRTCEEVLAASKKKPKGEKCIQCWTYGCLFIGS